MTKPLSDSSFTDDVARFYESTLVPLILESHAEDLASRAQALEPNAVLEVACGTGVVTRALATALPPACEIIATDPTCHSFGPEARDERTDCSANAGQF